MEGVKKNLFVGSGGGGWRPGRGEGGRTNERPGTDHVFSGPMRGLRKTAPNGANRHPGRQTHTHRQGNSITESNQIINMKQLT